MKNHLLEILNKELSNAEIGVLKAFENSDLIGKMVWLKYKRLIEKLIKTKQDKS